MCIFGKSVSKASILLEICYCQPVGENEGGGGGGAILSESSCQCLLAADLLPADEGVHRDCDGAVDVLRGAVFGQAHFAEGFADAHDGF